MRTAKILTSYVKDLLRHTPFTEMKGVLSCSEAISNNATTAAGDTRQTMGSSVDCLRQMKKHLLSENNFIPTLPR